MRFIHVSSIILAGIVCFVQSAFAETRVTYKSAKSTSSYYQMGVQIAEAMKQAHRDRSLSLSKKARVRFKMLWKQRCARGIMCLPHRLF